jgi:hypothetical protein
MEATKSCLNSHKFINFALLIVRFDKVGLMPMC